MRSRVVHICNPEITVIGEKPHTTSFQFVI